MNRKKSKAKGTTLIEVTVVVATIGLLVSVFAPTLSQARQQARVAKCLQNLRSITQAAAGYVQENGTLVFAFPFDYHIDGEPANFNLATEFIWGGGVPDRRKSAWDPNMGINPVQFNTDVYWITPADRPLNAYMIPGVWWSDPDRIKNSSVRRRRPMLLPDVFQCPSDSSAHVPMAGAVDPDLPPSGATWYPTWQWWGTSYAVNWYWAYYYAQGNPSHFFNMLTSGALGETLFQEKADRGASEFILFYENRFNYAAEAASPRGCPGWEEPKSLTGWHGEQDVHVAGFLDGSARYQHFDTAYVDGPGWTLWPNRPWIEYWEAYQDN